MKLCDVNSVMIFIFIIDVNEKLHDDVFQMFSAAFPSNERVVGGADVTTQAFAPWQVRPFTYINQGIFS